MRRIAHVDTVQRIIINVSLSEDDAPLQPGTMTETDAIAQGFTRVSDPVEPAPDFDGMSTALRKENGFTDAFLEAFAKDPIASGSLQSRFDDFRKDGDYSLFLQSLALVLGSLESQHAAELGAEMLAIASRCNMPAAFIQDMVNAVAAGGP